MNYNKCTVFLLLTIVLQETIYAKPYTDLSITILPQNNVLVTFDMQEQITQSEYQDKKIVADEIKNLWCKDLTSPHGFIFNYSTSQSHDNGIYEKTINTKAPERLKKAIIEAQRAFRDHLNTVKSALNQKKLYNSNVDTGLVNNPYSVANRTMYQEIRKLLKTIGIQLPELDAACQPSWLRRHWRKLFMMTLLAGGVVLGAKYLNQTPIPVSNDLSCAMGAKKVAIPASNVTKTTPLKMPSSPATPVKSGKGIWGSFFEGLQGGGQ